MARIVMRRFFFIVFRLRMVKGIIDRIIVEQTCQDGAKIKQARNY